MAWEDIEDDEDDLDTKNENDDLEDEEDDEDTGDDEGVDKATFDDIMYQLSNCSQRQLKRIQLYVEQLVEV